MPLYKDAERGFQGKYHSEGCRGTNVHTSLSSTHDVCGHLCQTEWISCGTEVGSTPNTKTKAQKHTECYAFPDFNFILLDTFSVV